MTSLPFTATAATFTGIPLSLTSYQLGKPLSQPGSGGNVNLPGGGHDRIVPFAPDPDGRC